jgi:uncharacterized protein
MAEDLGVEVKNLFSNPALVKKIPAKKYVNKEVGLPTVLDILAELEKPGQDPREAASFIEFTKGINYITDLLVGQKLTGLVKNITAFGAFVDVGVDQSGFVHKSQITTQYVYDLNAFIKIGQKITCWVDKIDHRRKRLYLTMIDPSQEVKGKKISPPNSPKAKLKKSPIGPKLIKL